MQKKLLLMAVGTILFLAMPREAGASACTAARFNDWRDTGCDPSYAGAGSAPTPKACSDCGPGFQVGMPRWWVREPYINLWMSDTPLSYTLSSGEPMGFTFYYKQRYQLPSADELPDCPLNWGPFTIGSTVFNTESYFRSGIGHSMTNEFWGNNWQANIFFWNPNSAATNFQNGYHALVFNPEGSINYFFNTNNILYTTYPPVTNWLSSLRDPQSQVQLQPLSGLKYPTIGFPVADGNGIYWGDSQTNGFQLVKPDGSKEVFGLCPSEGPTIGYAAAYYALLTQRIDAQGRKTKIGYEYKPYPATGTAQYHAYRVRYVVDPDGRTNTFQYVSTQNQNVWQISEIDDPYGRKTQLGYNSINGYLTNVVDAAGLTNSFTYQGTNGLINNLSTPYGNTGFNYYELPDPGATEPDSFIQRAIYVTEPTGAQQLYYYLHNNTAMATTSVSPVVAGQTFDDGTTGGLSGHNALTYRNTFHWGRRQFAALSSGVQSVISGNLSNALVNLTTADYNKAGIKHWLLSSLDTLSMTEGLSSEQDPSPDADGLISGLRTWYNYPDKPSGGDEELGSSPQISCIARLLPDGTSQYTTYNYFPLSYTNGGAGFVSDTESTFSLPDGSVGLLTNQFRYALNGVDLLSVNNSSGGLTNYEYNEVHQITSLTNALDQRTTLSWDANTHNLTNILLPAGKSIGFTYYATSSTPTVTSAMIQQITIQPEGRVFNINNYQAGNPASVTDDQNLNVTNSWDGLNRLTSTVFPDGTYISNIYFRLDLVAVKDRLGYWKNFCFDGLQHLTAVTNANNAVTMYSWCGCGSLMTIIDALTNLTTLSHDNQGNLTGVSYPDASSVTYQFDLAGRMTNAFDGAGRSVQIGYNNQGLATTITGANGLLKQTIYDALNRAVRITDANGVTVTNQFDPINELLKRTWPDGISETFGYSTNGMVAYTNRDQQATIFIRDSAKRILAVTNANHEGTHFGYDSLNNVTNLVDGLNHTTKWQYNEYGWLTNKIDGRGSNIVRYAYNANGWTTNRWTPEKGNTGYAYDNVGNLKAINYSSSSISFAFDALNRLTNMVDAVGTTAFSYTPAGRLQSENGPWTSDSVIYTYVQGLRTVLNLTQPSDSWSQSYNYDAMWRMTNITSPAGVFGYGYNFNSQPASSLVTGINLPNGAAIVNSYDGLARLTGTALNNHWSHALDSYTYTPDALGLRTNIVRNLGLTTSTVTVSFDNIGQLTGWNAAEAGGTLRQNEQLGFGYDAAHNLHTRNSGSLAQTFTTDAANQLNSVTRTGTFTMNGATPAPATSVTVNGLAAQTYGDFTFAATNLSLVSGNNTFTNIAQNSYGAKATNVLTLNLPSSVNLNSDNNGSLTNDGARTFTYDSESQLTNITLAGQWKSDFVYDGLNRRRIARDFGWQAGAWVLTNEVRYIYDGNLILQERDTNNAPLATYTRGLDLKGGLQRAGGIGGLLARTDTNGSAFYHADGAGNITALMDGNENIVARYLYNPFGKLLGQWGSLANANTMQFSSMPQIRGITLYPFRGYEPNFQRFLNQDPIAEEGGINLYQLAENSPLNFIDPFGLSPLGPGRDMLMGGGGGGGASAIAAAREAAMLEEALAMQAEMAAAKVAQAEFQAANAKVAQEIADAYLPKNPTPPQNIQDCPKIYRGGRNNDSAIKDIRADPDGVSFRDSLSNPRPEPGQPPLPVLRPGKPFIEVDTSKLPPGSVIHDNSPPGHVSVKATPEQIANAINKAGSGKFPN